MNVGNSMEDIVSLSFLAIFISENSLLTHHFRVSLLLILVI